MNEGSVVQQGVPLISGAQEIRKFDRDALITALRTDQEGRGTFPEFLRSAWEAGVIGYDADLIAHKVIYYGSNGESYSEEYPAVAVVK